MSRIAAINQFEELAAKYGELHSTAFQVVRKEKEFIVRAERSVEDWIKTVDLFQRAAEEVQEAVHSKIANLVTRCLEVVYPTDPYEFRFVFDRKRGKTEARPVFFRDGMELDPLREAGGGPVQVAAFGLRIAALVLERPARRKLLVLDEPFAALDSDAAPAVAELLLTLAEELGVQIVLSTHSESLACGKVVRVSKNS